MLNILSWVTGCAANVCEVTLSSHSQQPLEVVKAVVARISGFGLKTVCIVLPELVETFTKVLDGFLRQAPGLWIKQNTFVSFRKNILFVLPLKCDIVELAT